MDKLLQIKAELQTILTNFQKSKNRPYTNKTLNGKKEQVDSLLNEAKEAVKITIDVETGLQLKAIYNQIKDIADNITKIIKDQENKMPFDIKTATSLVQPFNGNEVETESFIESIELLNELTPTEHKEIMLKFIKTRITGQAKMAINENIKTLTELQEKLRQKFSLKLSSDALISQIRTCRQGTKKLADFSSQMENLSRQLAKAFAIEKVTTGEAAEKLAEKFTIQAFAENVSNSETSLILKASNLQTLSEMVAKATAVDKPPASNIMHYHTTRPRTNANQTNRRRVNNNQYTNRGNWSSQNGQNRNRQNFRPQQSPHRARYNNDNRYNNRTNNTRDNNNRRRINYLDSGEYQAPQSDEDAGRLRDVTITN